MLVLVRSVRRWRATPPLERLQLTPVYVCALLTFLLVATAKAGAGDAAWWAAFISSALLPFAFLGGLLRSHVSQLDAELRERLEELRASRARLVEAGDAERRRLERDLHDGAQSRLVALALLLRTARAQAAGPVAELLDRAQEELQAGLAELRELARGIHPAVLTERGLEPALQALVARVPVQVTVEADADGRLPEPVESAAYFVVSEALANVSKYARATHATVSVRRVERARRRRGRRRRRRRRRRGAWLGPARTGRPRGGARRHARARQPAGSRHAPARGDPRRAEREPPASAALGTLRPEHPGSARACR